MVPCFHGLHRGDCGAARAAAQAIAKLGNGHEVYIMEGGYAGWRVGWACALARDPGDLSCTCGAPAGQRAFPYLLIESTLVRLRQPVLHLVHCSVPTWQCTACGTRTCRLRYAFMVEGV